MNYNKADNNKEKSESEIKIGSIPVLGTQKPHLNSVVSSFLGLSRTKCRTKLETLFDIMPDYNYPPYQYAFVYIGKNDAFVSYSWFNKETQKYKRDKLRLGIKGLAPKTRKLLLNELCVKVNKVLEYRNSKLIYHDDSLMAFKEFKYQDGLFLDVFEIFKNDEEIAQTQRDLAKSFISRYSEFSQPNPEYSDVIFSSISARPIKKYVEFLEQKGLTGKTINNHLWIIGKVMEKMSERVGLSFTFEPEKLRVKQVKNETDIYKPLSFNQKELIFGYFKELNPNYYLFLLFIYYTCIRPSEIMRLQLEHINLKDRTIYVPWFNSKNGLSKYVQILDPLYKVLIDLNLHQHPMSHYLFGHRFYPGAVKKSSHNVSELWLDATKRLKIENRQMYGLKHTFNRDYVENNKSNIDWEWLRRHNRHATVQQTQDYISGLTAYFLNETKNIILDHT